MSVKKKTTPSNAEQLEFLDAKKVKLARKKLEERKKLGMETDPVLANAAKRPGRPYKCLYPSNKRYHLEMPELYYLFLKAKAEEENSTIRQLILDAVAEVYEKEIDKIVDLYS